jgi:hypothetical protein
VETVKKNTQGKLDKFIEKNIRQKSWIRNGLFLIMVRFWNFLNKNFFAGFSLLVVDVLLLVWVWKFGWWVVGKVMGGDVKVDGYLNESVLRGTRKSFN